MKPTTAFSLAPLAIIGLLLVAGCAADYVPPADKPYGIITFEREVGEYATGRDVINYKRPRNPFWTIDGVTVYGATESLDHKSIRATLGSHVIAPAEHVKPTLLLTVKEGVISFFTDYVDEEGWGYRLIREEPDPAY